MKKLYGPTTHCAIDYVFVATLLAAPSLFKLTGAARTLCYAFGVAAGGLTAITDQPLSVKRIIPTRVHGQVDTPFVPILLLLPYLTGDTSTAQRPPVFSSPFFPSFSPIIY